MSDIINITKGKRGTKMNLKRIYSVEELTIEEKEAAMEAIIAVRKKNERLAKLGIAEGILSAAIARMIELVGIEETKT